MRWINSIALVLLANIGFAQINFQWTYSSVGYERGRAVVEKHDSSGFVMAGVTSTGGPGTSDVYVVEVDSLGQHLQTKVSGSANVDWAYELIRTPGKGYAFVGTTNGSGNGGYDVYFGKLDSLLNVEWIKTIGGSDWDLAYSLDLTQDSGYILAGETYSFGAGEKDMYLVRLNATGDTLWTRTYGGAEDDWAKEVITLHDGGFAVLGTTESFGAGKEDYYLVRTDGYGDTVWTKTYGDTTYDSGSSLVQLADSNIVMLGTSDSPMSFADLKDFWALKVDTNGVEIWNKFFGTPGDEYGEAVTPIGTGHIALAGYGGSGGAEDVVWYAIDNGGWYQTGGTIGGLDREFAYDIAATSDKGFVLSGVSETYGNGLSSAYLIKIDSLYQSSVMINDFNDTFAVSISEVENYKQDFAVFPIPASYSLNVEIPNSLNGPFTISLFDIYGAQVMSENFTRNQTSIVIGKLANGIYLLRLRDAKGVLIEKTIVKSGN